MDASSALALYRRLQRDGIALTVDGPDLVIEPFSQVSADDLAQIREAKRHLMVFVQHPPERWIPEFDRIVQRLRARNEGVAA